MPHSRVVVVALPLEHVRDGAADGSRTLQ
jgi:hypothetical protein